MPLTISFSVGFRFGSFPFRPVSIAPDGPQGKLIFLILENAFLLEFTISYFEQYNDLSTKLVNLKVLYLLSIKYLKSDQFFHFHHKKDE